MVSSTSQGFGKVVHAIAERMANGDIDVDADLMPLVDEVWGRMEFRTPWSGARERAGRRDALRRFVAWHDRPGARTVLATEPQVRAEVTLPDGQVVRLHGYADRLELDEDGRVVVVDLKTGKYPPTGPAVLEPPPARALPARRRPRRRRRARRADRCRSGGAELVQLRRRRRAAQGAGAAAAGRRGRRATPVEEQLMAAAATRPRRGVRGPARSALRALLVQGDLPRHRPPGTVLS